MTGSDVQVALGEKEWGRVWQNYMGRMMIDENDWVNIVETYTVESPVKCLSRLVVQVFKIMARGKASRHSGV